jgi:hypothetical protein
VLQAVVIQISFIYYINHYILYLTLLFSAMRCNFCCPASVSTTAPELPPFPEKSQVKRVVMDVLKNGWSQAHSAPCLLRVPWLEVETEEPFDWSLDGEPASHPSTYLRCVRMGEGVDVGMV